jgi:hypothetical protein
MAPQPVPSRRLVSVVPLPDRRSSAPEAVTVRTSDQPLPVKSPVRVSGAGTRSTMLLSTLIVTPPQVSLCGPRYCFIRRWPAHRSAGMAASVRVATLSQRAKSR